MRSLFVLESFESCSFADGTVIYYSDMMATTGIGTVYTDKKAMADKSLYDLSGRKVTGTPRSGIYIRGGRKVVVK